MRRSAAGAMQGVGRNAAGESRGQRLLDRPRLRPAARIALVGAAPADAVMLLGDVGEVEEVREAARDRHSATRSASLAARSASVSNVRRRSRRAGSLGERAHALDALEERLALLPPQRFAEQFAEQPHVVAQRLVGVFAHKLIILRQMTGSRRGASEPALPSPE